MPEQHRMQGWPPAPDSRGALLDVYTFTPAARLLHAQAIASVRGHRRNARLNPEVGLWLTGIGLGEGEVRVRGVLVVAHRGAGRCGCARDAG